MDNRELNRYIDRPTLRIVDAMKKIDANAKQVLFIVDAADRLIGCVTDGDIRRFLIKTGNLQASVELAMNSSPKCLLKNDCADAVSFCCEQGITAVPVVDDDRKILDIVFKEKESMVSSKSTSTLMGIPVVIMAGGAGTRLYPYTKILPKPLIPIGDVPIIERIMDRFVEFGISDFYLTVNYKKGMIRSYFNDLSPQYRISYVEESKPLGTAGSIRLIEDEFQTPLFVTNCDTLIEADYSEIMNYHLRSGNDITVVSSLKNIAIPYGVLHFKEEGKVTKIEEKPHLSYFVNTGLYVINPSCIDYIPENSVFNMTDLIDALMKANKRVGTYPISEDSFLDMGEFEEMKRMEERLNISRG